MRTVSVKDIKELYHDYLLEVHKDWNRPGTHTDSAKQRVSDTMYLWNHGNKVDFWKYLSGELRIDDAHNLIKKLLKENGANEQRQNGYCSMLDDFKQFIDIKLGGINDVVDDEHVIINEVYFNDEGKKLRSISSEDNISFEYNYKALNACFGASMKGTYQHALWGPVVGCL